MIHFKPIVCSAILLTIGFAGCGGSSDRPPTQDEQKKAEDLAKDFRAKFPPSQPKTGRPRR